MAAWHHRDPARAKAEITAVQAEFPGLRLLGSPDHIRGWSGTVRVAGQARNVEVQYPDDYPTRAPSVWDRAFTATWGDFWQSGHQYPDRSLCLFADGHGPGAWHAERTTADALRQYVQLVDAWLAGELSNDYGARVEAALARACVGRAFVPATIIERMALTGAYGRVWLRKDRATPDAYLERLTVASHDGLDAECGDAWTAARGEADSQEGVWWSLDHAPNPGDWSTVAATRPARLRDRPGPVVVHTPKGVLASLDPHGRSLLRVSKVSLKDSAFARVEGAVPRWDSLDEGTVVLVGLGSLGSRIADLLARSGVRHFHLFDPERLEPENLSRHLGDLTDLYCPKVEVVARHIHLRRPDAEVHQFQTAPLFQFNWQPTGAAQSLRRAIRRPTTVVVMTTADGASEQALNRLALQAECPVIYATALGAAEHGRVFRVLPEKTACYRCVTSAQAAGERHGNTDEVDDAYRTGGLPGLAIQLDHVAAIAARLTLATLAARCDVEVDLGPIADHTLWTNRGGWIFDRPLQAIDDEYTRRPDCPACAPRATAPLDPALAALIAQAAGGDCPST